MAVRKNLKVQQPQRSRKPSRLAKLEPLPLAEFGWQAFNVGTAELFEFPQHIQAKDLGHALQIVAAALPDSAVEVQVWIMKPDEEEES